jgi:uncharacterized protein YciI
MQQYVIIAQDGTDEDALERRMQARPFHLAGAKKLKEQNNLCLAELHLMKKGRCVVRS